MHIVDIAFFVVLVLNLSITYDSKALRNNAHILIHTFIFMTVSQKKLLLVKTKHQMLCLITQLNHNFLLITYKSFNTSTQIFQHAIKQLSGPCLTSKCVCRRSNSKKFMVRPSSPDYFDIYACSYLVNFLNEIYVFREYDILMYIMHAICCSKSYYFLSVKCLT